MPAAAAPIDNDRSASAGPHGASPLHPAPIPRGVADYFWAEARTRRDLVTELLALFSVWGYQEVMPPAFEYAATLDERASPELRDELYRFVDRDGSTLALRADMTIPVARLVATRLHDVPMPQRFCYAGSVFRYGAGQAGLQREFWQAGVELIGAAGAGADAEVLALTVRALEKAGTPASRLAVGHSGYFDGLMAELPLASEARTLLLDAVDRNSDAALEGFLRQTVLPAPARAALTQLPHLSGSHAEEILERALSLSLNETMRAAVAEMRTILDVYAAHQTGVPVYLDLTEVHNLGYYTGLVFEALSPALGFPLASGGRYDQLVGSFGGAQPAVGAAILLDRLLLALRQTAPERLPARFIAPDLLIGGEPGGTLFALAGELRAQRLIVQHDHDAHADIGSLWAASARMGTRAALLLVAGELWLQEQGARPRRIDADELRAWARRHDGAWRPPASGANGGGGLHE